MVKIIKIAFVVAGIMTAGTFSVFIFIVMYFLIQGYVTKDFILGKAGNVEQILIRNGLNERVFNDKESMEYLENSFKTFKMSAYSRGDRCSIFIYYKYRPKIYGEIYIEGRNPEKACIWVNGDDGARFDFELPKPFPEGIRKIIDFIK